MALIVSKPTEPKIVHNWPVVVYTALDEGKIRKDEIFVDYQVLPQSEVDGLIEAASRDGQSADIVILRSSVKSINGLVDEANGPIPFNDETFADALDRVNVRGAMAASFFDVQNGRKPARKN